jgi:hypothetical protein
MPIVCVTGDRGTVRDERLWTGMCPNSGHRALAGMPVTVCHDAFATWTRDFFTRALAS